MNGNLIYKFSNITNVVLKKLLLLFFIEVNKLELKTMSKKNDDFKEAAGFTAGGAAAGAGVAATVGNMGLAGAFGGVAIGAAPVVAAGAVVGLAAYGLKKIFD